MPKLLISYLLPAPSLQALAQHFELIYPTEKQSFDREDILRLIPEVDAYLAVNAVVDREVIDHGTKLKIIANYGAGYDDIDTNHAASQDIIVTNTPTAVTEATAELAFGLMLSLLRNIAFCDRQLRYQPDFEWGMLKQHTGCSLYGKTLGLIGMGRIGQAVARRAIVSGMQVIYYQRHPLFDRLDSAIGAKYVSLDTLLSQADIVSLHVPLNDSTHHLVDERALEKMRPSAYLVNTARGAVIKQSALIQHLQEGKLAGAALDVFEDEPQIPKALIDMDKVVLTPHIGTETQEARMAMAAEAQLNLVKFFQNERPPHVVN